MALYINQYSTGVIIMATKKSSRKQTKKTSSTSSSDAAQNQKICAILQYFFPIGLIWWLVDEQMKKNSFVKFHLKQSLVLVVLSVALNIIFTIMPFLMLIGWIVHIAIFVLWILGLINAVNGKEKEVPIVGKFTSYFKF